MNDELVPRKDVDAILSKSPGLREAFRHFQGSRLSKNTKRAYKGDVLRFASWCELHGISALTASQEAVSLYAAWLATEGNWYTGEAVRPSTIERAVAGICAFRKDQRLPSPRGPILQEQIQGIRKSLKAGERHRKAPLLRADIESAVSKLTGPRATRDAALLWLGWSWALRRSELVAVAREHISAGPAGLVLLVPDSKTDQEGEGVSLGVPHGSATAAILQWLEVAKEGPVFVRFDRYGAPIFGRALESGQVSRIVKRAARALKLDPRSYGGHSLRSGWMTQASKSGVPLQSIMRHSRHESVRIALGYIHQSSPFDEATRGVWS